LTLPEKILKALRGLFNLPVECSRLVRGDEWEWVAVLKVDLEGVLRERAMSKSRKAGLLPPAGFFCPSD
jgi:hypothetical protein